MTFSPSHEYIQGLSVNAEGAAKAVKTPYGDAIQDMSEEALKLKIVLMKAVMYIGQVNLVVQTLRMHSFGLQKIY